MDTNTVSPFIAALPKVELHLHLVGSAAPETVLELARRHPDAGVPTELDELIQFYEFVDFPHFIKNYERVDSMVRVPEDIGSLVLGLARDAAASNVRYAEVTVTAAMHLAKGIAPEELADALTASRAAAAERYGVALNWIFDIPAGFGQQVVDDTVRFAVEHRPPGTVALGLAGLEKGFPRADYRGEFDVAREAGLHAVVHAGETTGPDEVWSAIRELGAERIGHGIGSVTDPALLDYLRDKGIPLEVCPTSNVCTRAVTRIEDHPLPVLVRHGIPVTLSTDDPGMFHTDLNREYAVAAELGLTDADLAELARNGVRAAYCDDDLRARLLAEIDLAIRKS
jgi:aminodeoxyfutalosine deaminase